jgi:hypothetical protein
MQIDPASLSTTSVTAAYGVTPTTSASPPPTAYLGGTIDQIGQLLGLSTPALQSQLAQGTSLGDIASSQGVSRSDLVSFIEQQVQQNRRSQGQSPIDAAILDQGVNRAVDRHGHHHHAAAAAPARRRARRRPAPPARSTCSRRRPAAQARSSSTASGSLNGGTR